MAGAHALKASIQAGSVAPSVILRKLAAAGAGNALSRALRALGRIERTLFTLQWLSDPDLRQRSHAGLNKGEASNSLRRAVFFHRHGEIRDRTFENQSFRASSLTFITAAIVHWNTVYLDRAVRKRPTNQAPADCEWRDAGDGSDAAGGLRGGVSRARRRVRGTDARPRGARPR